MSDTPETDNFARGNHVVPTEFAQDLERRLKSEQDELFKIHRINERLMTECDQYHYERDVAVEALHKCYAATGEEAGDIGDFIALVDREKHTVKAVREMRKQFDWLQDEHDEQLERNAELAEGWLDWRECAKSLYEAMEAAISSGDWKVDGACDPDIAMARFRRLVGVAE
jgi:hypothetical protein